jgi:hypothetical protein
MQETPAPPTLFELFLGFLSVGMYGCGGELPWARCMVVEKRCRMTAGESTDLLVHSSASAALRIRTTVHAPRRVGGDQCAGLLT